MVKKIEISNLRKNENKILMISVLAPTGRYILQPSLMEMHNESTEWLSVSQLWKRELAFFEKLLVQYAPKFESQEDKKKIGHFESLITYYQGELVDQLRKKVRDHEGHLARMLQELNESDTEYFKEHKGIMEELKSFEKNFSELKSELFAFIENGM